MGNLKVCSYLKSYVLLIQCSLKIVSCIQLFSKLSSLVLTTVIQLFRLAMGSVLAGRHTKTNGLVKSFVSVVTSILFLLVFYSKNVNYKTVY